MRVAPGLGGQHFNALGDQHGSLTLHLCAVLQVFDGLDAFGQLHLETGQRLARQRRAGFGGVPLPGQGVGQIELGQRQQRLGLVRPFGGHGFLALGALDVVELFLHQFGRALVAVGQVLEDLGHLLGARVLHQPVTDAADPFTGGSGRQGTTRQRVQRVRFSPFGLGRFGVGGVGFRGVGHGAS